MEHISLDELVMHPTVPLMKHTRSMTVRTTAAALLCVAWYISFVAGMCAFVPRTVSGSVRQKSITRMNAVPLCTHQWNIQR